jgi:hypothetical protein
MKLQEFLTTNKLAAGKAVIGSPVKLSIEENVSLSAIDALSIDEFLIQEDEFGQPCRVDVILDGIVVAYVHVEYSNVVWVRAALKRVAEIDAEGSTDPLEAADRAALLKFAADIS